MNLFVYLREKLEERSISWEKYIPYLKDKSILTIIVAFIIGVALFELGAIILIDRFSMNEYEAYNLCENTFNEQQYDTAVKCLKGFVKKFPRSEKVSILM